MELSRRNVEGRVTPGATRFGSREDRAGVHRAHVDGALQQPFVGGLAFELTRVCDDQRGP